MKKLAAALMMVFAANFLGGCVVEDEEGPGEALEEVGDEIEDAADEMD